MFGIGGGLNQYNATGAQNLPTSDYGAAVKSSMAAQPGIFGQQQGLVTQLGQQAAGNGPSLAQPLLQQATDQNSNLAAGAIASQRGINPGLAARQILQSRAGMQQQSAQQAATLRAQEQLGAQGLQANVLGTMGQQNIAGLQTAGGLQNTQNSIAVQNALGAQGINAGVAQQNAGIEAGAIGGLLGGIGTAVMPKAAAHGALIPGKAPVAGDSPRNDKVPAMLSPGEIVLPRSVVQSGAAPEKAAAFVRALHRHHKGRGMSDGGEVPHYGRDVLAKLRSIEAYLKDLPNTAAMKHLYELDEDAANETEAAA